jgi:asparagine synthase (glutamine-hydrolysing)
MCGIAGQVSFERRPAAGDVARLVHGIRHRGPDDHGVWTTPAGECVLGHARLSIIDLSAMGHQPMLDPETGNSIVFNGEIYNFQQLRRECERRRDRFRSDTDTEVILALYRRYGPSCLGQLRGMFAFAIWDATGNRLFIARDRVGKKPLNYAMTDGGLAFCSEIHPLSRHPEVSRALDREALELYLQLQYIPAPWTIYRSIRKLPPAHFGLFDRNGLQMQQYWEVDYAKKCELAEEDALDALEEKLTEAVRLRMIADVPLGALLSGGVDSSLVVALMARVSGTPVRTYSMGFREEAFSELRFAEQAAKFCGTDHHPSVLEADVETILPLIARHYGEPYADSSAVPSVYVCRNARRHVTVAMTGDGGDELLGGYPRYWLSNLQMQTAGLVPDVASPQALSWLAARLPAIRGLPARAIRKVLIEYVWPQLRSVWMYREFWNDEERAALLGRDAMPSLLPGWRSDWLGRSFRRARHPVDRMLWLDSHTYLPGDLLVKMDIASMHCGLEVRSPLLDHEIIEFCAALPLALKVRAGVGKYLLKRLAERYFPRDFVHRRKMGFGIPLAEWLRGPLRAAMQEILSDPVAMAPLSLPKIEQALMEFLAGQADHSSRLWALLMLGNWRLNAERSE